MVDNMAVSKTIEIHALTMVSSLYLFAYTDVRAHPYNSRGLILQQEMKAQGQMVYSLCVGEPDYQPPEEVLAATGRTAMEGNTKYTSVSGEMSLRQNIALDLKKRKGVQYDPNQIVGKNMRSFIFVVTLLTCRKSLHRCHPHLYHSL